MGYPTGYQDLVRCALVRVGAYRRRIVAPGAEDRSRVWSRELVIDSEMMRHTLCAKAYHAAR
jgi:hypothetical protein